MLTVYQNGFTVQGVTKLQKFHDTIRGTTQDDIQKQQVHSILSCKFYAEKKEQKLPACKNPFVLFSFSTANFFLQKWLISFIKDLKINSF